MTIVFDNIVFSLQRYGGISVVWANLISRMQGRDHDIMFLEYAGAMNNIARKTLEIPREQLMASDSWLIKLRRYLNPSVKCDKPFIFHSSYFRTCNNAHAINITTVHDFTYEYYVKNPVKRWLHCYQKHAAIRHADHIVCISENTKRDLLKFFPNIPQSRVSVIYNGVNEVFRPLSNKQQKDYILFVGNRDGYKNFKAVIEPVAESGRQLVITGKRLSEEEERLLEAAHVNYRYAGMVDEEELNLLYNEAFCLLYPSLYEGFGLPVIEAQKAGCPVIAYNCSSIKEVIGNTPLLLQSTTSTEIAEKLKILNDSQTRQEVIRKGFVNAKQYSWDKMAMQYAQLYYELTEKL